MIEVFSPQGVLELGAGKFSTPLFYHRVPHVVTVETDQRWIEELRAQLPPREHFALVHHSLPGITWKTRIGAIPTHTKVDSVKLYQRLLDQHPLLNLLFIDHVSGLRAFTLSEMYHKFDLVVYHDAEDTGYGYENFAERDNGDHIYRILDKFIPHTGILIHKKLSDLLSAFAAALDRHAQAYYDQHYGASHRNAA